MFEGLLNCDEAYYYGYLSPNYNIYIYPGSLPSTIAPRSPRHYLNALDITQIPDALYSKKILKVLPSTGMSAILSCPQPQKAPKFATIGPVASEEILNCLTMRILGQN